MNGFEGTPTGATGSSGGLTVRRFHESDAEAVFCIDRSARLEFCAPFYPEHTFDRWADATTVDDYIAQVRFGYKSYIALLNDELIGFACLADDELCDLAVAPSQARKGVGAALFRAAVFGSLSEGFPRIHLLSTLNAVPFFERQGCAPLKTRGLMITGGAMIDVVHMERCLVRPNGATGRFFSSSEYR